MVFVAVAINNDRVGAFEEGVIFRPTEADLGLDAEIAFVEALGEQLAAGWKLVLIPYMARRTGYEKDLFGFALNEAAEGKEKGEWEK